MPVRTQHCWPTTPNIVGCYMLRPFAHPVARCWMLLRVVGQCLKPVKLFSQQLPTFLLLRDRRSVAQQCWIRLHSSVNIVGATHAHYARFTKTYGLYPSHDVLQVPTLLAQQCWELLQPFAHSLRFVWCHGCHVNAHASHATIIIAFDSRAQVIQVLNHALRLKCIFISIYFHWLKTFSPRNIRSFYTNLHTIFGVCVLRTLHRLCSSSKNPYPKRKALLL